MLFDSHGVILGLALSFFPFMIRLIPNLKQNFSSSYTVFKSKIHFILNSHVIDVSGILRGQISNLLIAPLFGFALLGNYFLVIQILSFLAIIPSSIFRFTLSEDSSGKQTKNIKIFGIVFITFITILAVFVLPPIVEIIFPEYTHFSILMPIMCFALIPSNIGLMFSSKILSKEKSKHPLISNCFFVVTFVTGIFTLGDVFDIVGVAYSYLLASCISTIYLGIIYRQINN